MEDLDPAGRVIRRFRARFGREPSAVATAPGRVSLIGEHVDHRGGVVLPFAIDRRTAVAVAISTDNHTTIVADDLGVEARWPGGPPTTPVTEPHSTFANHVLGVLAAIDSSPATRRPLSIAIASTLPVGGGLSSSAALEVATTLAVFAALEQPVPDIRTLVRIARRAEHDWVGIPCGVMDMLVSAAARRDRVLHIDCDTLDARPIRVPWSEDIAIVLLDSGVRHRLADGGYAERLATLDRVESRLGRPLRSLTLPDLVHESLGSTAMRRARHVVTEIERVRKMTHALHTADLSTIGRILFEGHASLRDDFEVSIPELDVLVDGARDRLDQGAIGARMTGGGFGGWVLLLARRDRVERLRAELANDFLTRFGREPAMMEVHPSEGARLEATSTRPVSYPPGRPLG